LKDDSDFLEFAVVESMSKETIEFSNAWMHPIQVDGHARLSAEIVQLHGQHPPWVPAHPPICPDGSMHESCGSG
jgi:hypothetical protein